MKQIKNEQTPTIWLTLKRLLSYLKASRLLIVIAIIGAVIGTLLEVVTPKLLGNATDTIVAGIGSETGLDFRLLLKILVTIASLMVGAFLMSVLHQRLMLVIAQRLTFTLRKQLKDKMNRLPLASFDKQANGKLMSIAINDMENIVNTLQSSLAEFITSVILLIGVIGFMLSISWQLTLVAALLIPASLIVMKALTPHTQKNNQVYLQKQGELNTQIEESYQGFAVIKSFNHEKAVLTTFNQTNEAMYQSGWRAQLFGGSMMPLMMLLENGVYILLAVFGGLKVVSGSLSIGNMQAFLQYSGQFSHPLIQASQIWNGLLSAIASTERVFKVLDEAELPTYPTDFVNHQDEAKVVFEQVDFSYGETPLLEKFDLAVAAGETVAIVGETGAGKSTLINLLERFYDVQGGQIRLNGIDTRNLSYHDLRQQLGMVLQDTWLFSGTIYDNIRYGNESASEEAIYRAAKAAYADDFIQKLPAGYQTMINEEGSNISQGQKQLLTIARAFVSNPDVLILDEATSNVDSRTEFLIQDGMKELMKGRTSFVVAHRLSTIYDADRIIVMKAGKIVEVGNHQALLRKQGEYADIYNSQFAQKSA